MTREEEQLLWAELDRQRGRELPPERLVQAAKRLGINLTLEDLGVIMLKVGRSYDDWFCPPHVFEFISKYVSEFRPQSMLDPWAGFGGLLIPLVKSTGPAQATAITSRPTNLALGRELDTQGALSWLCGDPLVQLETLQGSFDAVVSVLPWGLGFPERVSLSLDGGTVEVQDSVGNLLILKSALRLSESGVGVFVIPARSVSGASKEGVFASLSQFHLRLDASILLPAGTFSPLSSIPGAVVVLRRGVQESIFVGELTAAAAPSRTLLENLRARREGREMAMGRLIPAEEFRGHEALVRKDWEESMAARLGLTPVLLKTIAKEINSTGAAEPLGFEDRTNAVYLPKTGPSDAVTSLVELRLKPHNYFQLVIDPDRADSRYVAVFFNSPLGLAIRESMLSGVHIPQVSKAGLLRAKVYVIPQVSEAALLQAKVYLPDLAIQVRTGDAQARIGCLLAELTELRERLWNPRLLDATLEQVRRVNREDRFEDWLKDLPFPLATILWAYHVSSDNDRKQCDHLANFFEALAEFHATWLLSAFTTDQKLFEPERQRLKRVLKRGEGLTVSRSTFGTWVKICETLMKTARTLLNGKPEDRERCQNLFRTRDSNVLKAFLSPKLISVLQKANGLRNYRVHAGVVSDAVTRKIKSELEGLLASLRECFGNSWAAYPLILPSPALRFDGSALTATVQMVVNTRIPFKPVDVRVRLSEPLVPGQLYFKGKDDPSALKLLPFVKIMESPRLAQIACYFYNREEGDGVRFVSYHFEEEPVVTGSFPDTVEVIRKVLRLDS